MSENRKIFIAKLEIADMQPKNFGDEGMCLRFHGFEEGLLNDFVGGKGVDIFEIELDVKDCRICSCGNPRCRWAWPFERAVGRSIPNTNGWVRIELIVDKKGANYVYPLFSEEVSQQATISKLEVHRSLDDQCRLANVMAALGVTINSVPPQIDFSGAKNYEYLGFYVGQGMTTCLLDREGTGPTIFFDLGGGAPLLKKNYGAYRNSLHKALSKVGSTYLILSHWDSDHWRILCWDSKIWEVLIWYAPNTDIPDPKFNDKKMHKFLLAGNLSILDGDFSCRAANLMEFECFRHTDKANCNYDGFYTIIRKFSMEGLTAQCLMTGDLPYQKVKEHQSLVRGANFDGVFNSVVVPHHGDEESSADVPVPLGSKTTAFFSAGNHAHYNHPRPSSIAAHKENFSIIVDCKSEVNSKLNMLMSFTNLL